MIYVVCPFVWDAFNTAQVILAKSSNLVSDWPILDAFVVILAKFSSAHLHACKALRERKLSSFKLIENLEWQKFNHKDKGLKIY